MQDVAISVSGSSLSSVSVRGLAARLGEATAPIALSLGATAVPVTFTASGGLSKTYQFVFERGASILDQLAYGKASSTGDHDIFGASASLSGDTLAVGAYGESSAATGINGVQTDDSPEQPVCAFLV